MMKKVIAFIVAVVGLLLAAVGIQWKMKESASIGIIGGADGPTSIFIAGKVSDGMALGTLALGVLLIVVGILIYKGLRKK